MSNPATRPRPIAGLLIGTVVAVLVLLPCLGLSQQDDSSVEVTVVIHSNFRGTIGLPFDQGFAAEKVTVTFDSKGGTTDRLPSGRWYRIVRVVDEQGREFPSGSPQGQGKKLGFWSSGTGVRDLVWYYVGPASDALRFDAALPDSAITGWRPPKEKSIP